MTTSPTDDIASPGGAALALPTGAGAAPRAVAEVTTAPAHAAGLRLFGAQRGSGYRIPPSLVQRADGQVVQLTPLLYGVLCAVDGIRTEDEIAAVVSSQVGRAVVAEDVHTLVERKLRPLGLLKCADGSEPVVRKANPLLALRFRYVVSDPERTRRLTAPFAVLFHPAVAVPVTVCFVAVAYWVLFRKGLASAASEAFARPGMLLAVFAITVVSAGFHEFGHAAGLRRGGGMPGAMGAGLYMVWPAFYTDVTDGYRLGRGSRLRADLGGVYFNALLALATFGIWMLVRWDGLLLVIASQILQMLRQMPPLLRFDGYHVLADLTGVPDLYHRIGPTVAGLWPTRWHSPQTHALKPWARAVVTLWVLLVVPLLLMTALVMIVTLPRVIASAAHSLTVQWALLTGRWVHGDWAGVGVKILALVAVALPLLGVCYFLIRLVRQVIGGTLRRTKGKPRQRALAAAAALAVIAGLVAAWWPRGDYRPIQPNERGVIQQAFPAPHAVSSYFTGSSAPAGSVALSAGNGTSAGTQASAGTRASAGTQMPGGTRISAGTRMTAATVWPRDATQRPTPEHPQLAMVLIPRDPAGQTWVFPFNRPVPPGPGDNQSMAVATRDGSTVYDVAFALVTATTDTVLNTNEAYAFASCTGCTAVAVSFQVVLIIGNAQVIAPKNVSAAVAYNCISCLTAAIAVQLDISLPAAPQGSTATQFDALWKQVLTFGQHITSVSLTEIHAQLQQYEQQIEQILQPLASSSTAAPSPSPTATSTAGTGTPSPSPDATSTAGTGTPSPSASEPPTSSGPSPQPSSGPSDTGSTTPEPSGGTATPSSDPAPSP
jgi:putative peptide zinc metalloprotease protein